MRTLRLPHPPLSNRKAAVQVPIGVVAIVVLKRPFIAVALFFGTLTTPLPF